MSGKFVAGLATVGSVVILLATVLSVLGCDCHETSGDNGAEKPAETPIPGV